MQVISLGWGVQSFTLAAMSVLGELPPVDVALHADTTHERRATYEFAARWTPWLEQRGVKVVTVSPSGLRSDPLNFYKTNSILIPVSTATGSSPRGGRLRRQCTREWKIDPMRHWISAELARRGLSKSPGIVEQWLGISLDEVERMRPGDVRYIENQWPLIDRRMTRHDCTKWLARHGLEIPPKSSCVFCPYHDQSSWREMKTTGNGDWQKAIEVDRVLRKARPPFDVYLHWSLKPLEDVDLRSETERGQLPLFQDECAGICGV